MSDKSFPVCACADFWSVHHPECPVIRHMEKDRAEIERLTKGWENCDDHWDEEVRELEDEIECLKLELRNMREDCEYQERYKKLYRDALKCANTLIQAVLKGEK